MHFLLSFLMVCLSGHLIAASWTQTHRNLILKIHNDYRRGTKGACDMTNMAYDIQIEKKAKAWAKKCTFEHEKKGFGENIAWITKSGKESALVTEMAKMWYDEIKDFDYNAPSCGQACHYTQMIWANTNKVGCWAEDCSRLRNGGRNAYFLVCFYTPAGNYYGEKPYKKVCNAGDKTKKTNKGSNPTKQNNKNNKGGKANKDNDWDDWKSKFNNIGGDDGWDSWPEDSGNGWNVVKKTGNNGNGGQWTTYTAKRTFPYKK